MPENDLMLTHSDIEGAVTELAALSGVSAEDVWAAVREEAGGERTPEGLAHGVGVVADALEGAGLQLAADISAEDNDEVAASMVGDYLDAYPPSRYYAYTGQLPGSAEGHTIALTDTVGDGYRWDQTDPVDGYILQLATDSDAASQMFGLARSSAYDGHFGPHGTGGPDEILARSGHAAGVHLAGSTHSAHLEAEGGRGRHLKTCPRGCTRDHNQPRHAGVIHPEVQRYLEMAAEKMGNRERPHGNTHSYHPPSDAERARGRAAARSHRTARTTPRTPMSHAGREAAQRAARLGHT
jgi:hypothetical protein